MNTPIWKPLLILGILGLCGLSLYPIERRLKPGLDLAGGTTLIYEVDIPSGADAKTVVEDTIAVLSKRVDPKGLRNLVWRPLAGSRIEIQMAHASKQTHELRTRYEQRKEELFKVNISARLLDSALRMDKARRPGELKSIAAGNAMRLALLETLAEAHDALEMARGPYQDRQEQIRSTEAALKALPEALPERQEVQRQFDLVLGELKAATRQFLDAREVRDIAHDAVIATNIDRGDFEFILSLSNESAVDKPSPREEKIADLIGRHPGSEALIQAAAEAHAEYERIKGPLDDPKDLIRLLRGSGVLEFRIAPAPSPDFDQYRQEILEKGPRTAANRPFRWFKIGDISAFADTPTNQRALMDDPAGYFESRPPPMIAEGYGGDVYLLLSNQPDSRLTQQEPNWELEQVFRSLDNFGARAIAFSLNATGAQIMGNLTDSHINQPMAIVLDGKVMSAPVINSRITTDGIITGGSGGFTTEELDYLLLTLNAGSLQGRLSEDPISKHTISAQFGEDNIKAGLKASLSALIVVAVFMTLYYFFNGLVANFALAANVLIILGVMATVEATFTLPGIAGIVLTVGMAVDANVLIFERIREELERNAEVRTAVRLGFERAFSTIIDANLTTLITCFVLGYTATTEIRGFAVTLGIGIVATLFTVLFCSRVVIDLYLGLTRAKAIYMVPTVLPAIGRLLSPRIDWVGKRYALFGVSAIFIIGGIVAMAVRGQDMLDIEFRSGTQVTFELAEGKTLSIPKVRERLTDIASRSQELFNQNLPDLAGDRASVVRVGESAGDQGSAYTIATIHTNATVVERAMEKAFEDVLDRSPRVNFRGAGTGDDAPPVNTAPVYPIRKLILGENINRPEVDTEDMSDFLGGVAVVLAQMEPPLSIDQLEQRIKSIRQQSIYEHLLGRSFEVIGLDLDQAGGQDSKGALYESAVVVTRDGQTNYVEDPDSFAAKGGLAETEWNLVRDALLRETTLGSVSNFSPQISRTMKQQAIVALTLSLIAVVAYIWLRFGSLRYGLAAIVALVHDVFIALGLVAVAGMFAAAYPDSLIAKALMLSDIKINLALVAAVLTIVGYSLNDTIVIFDRIRENRGRLAVATPAIVNDSINQTISRTVLTSGTTLLALIVLYLFGGEGVHGFAFTMIVGVVVGTYSSIAIAASLLLIGRRQVTEKEGA